MKTEPKEELPHQVIKRIKVEREERVIGLKDNGATFNEIGEVIGVCGTRAREIYHRGLRRKSASKRWDEEFTVRLANCLCNMGINSLDELRKAYDSGKIHPFKNKEGKMRNFGWLTYLEVADILGRPRPERYLPKRCPHCGKEI